ncbi:MAG: hypothetical protein H0S85_07640 [Desulfovibrionaceae bacterium]|jgi:hypothetical protein|nr:hypothetical protein [Desulfovibrionaceae bacterium]
MPGAAFRRPRPGGAEARAPAQRPARRRCRYPGCNRSLPPGYWFYCPEHHALVSDEYDLDMQGL